MTAVVLRPFAADDLTWLVEEHAKAYRQAEGFDESFGPLVASILKSFLATHKPEREAGWIAVRGEARLGSIFCVEEGRPGVAKLRLFYLVSFARGLGLGQRLLDTCLNFAREAGYREIALWTHESHRAACWLYRKNNFALLDSRPVHSFGVDLVEQSWSRAL
ncbi:MAG: GNAT family N-acetyltransferase [Pseudomonadota bacterium]